MSTFLGSLLLLAVTFVIVLGGAFLFGIMKNGGFTKEEKM